MGPGTPCFPYQWFQMQTYESRTLYFTAILLYHCILGLAEIKTLHPREKIMSKRCRCPGKKFLMQTPVICLSIPHLSWVLPESKISKKLRCQIFCELWVKNSGLFLNSRFLISRKVVLKILNKADYKSFSDI